MCIVYGRKGKDAFTCVSNKGSSVVDYCVVGVEYVHIVCNFRVTTMSESIEEMKLTGEASRLFADYANRARNICHSTKMQLEMGHLNQVFQVKGFPKNLVKKTLKPTHRLSQKDPRNWNNWMMHPRYCVPPTSGG